MEAGEVKAIWIIGTNPVASMPNRARVIAGLQRAELVIVQDAFHPTETSRFADILLPGALWAEAEGTMVNSERGITLMQEAVAPPGDALADWQIISQVARHLGFGENFNYKTACDVFDEIRRTWNFQTGYDLRGISYENLRQQSRQWPCAPGEKNGKPIRYLNSVSEKNPEQPAIKFPTKSGKAQFFARPFLPPAELPDADFPFALTTGRVAHQWHTLTKTGKISTLNKLNPSAFVEIHPEDAAALGVENGALVKVSSRRGFAIYPAQITARVRPGDCFAPFHWNDLFGENLAVNAATSEAVDEISLQPEFKFTPVSLAKTDVKATEDFTPEQKVYLQNFLAGLRAAGMNRLTIPETAPFTPSQRKHLDELLK
jgi:sulfite reductase (NADPH) flavoprotein alpha-component